ncbi:rhodanese-like domain-containing protein [Ruegeria sediminis]|uniref:Rhodanese-like domain-containing protein n=1 Tax=Ruegeria sediminis TaxID=2583820 RepID=A0ABY2X3I0_9RHOB|nr:rhodanese-like domain-containing protein [Ruegeria sediminis]TMV09643.1 rhodanese-like domain-containing protein [Ruegeria sediminis]
MTSDGGFSGFLPRRALLIGGVAFVTFLAIREYRLTPPAYDGGSLSVQDAHEGAVAGDLVLIDIRTPQEWRATGIGEGAHPIDMRRADFVQAMVDAAGPDRNRAIALICARGVRSARLSLELAEAGFANIVDVPEGMLGSRAGPGWVKAGLPVRDYDGVAG